MSGFTFWLGTSATIIIALVVTFFAIKLAMSLAKAGFWGALEGILAFLLIIGVTSLLGWIILNWLYSNMKEGARNSPITSDVISILGQAPENFGLGEPKKQEAAAQTVDPAAALTAAMVATQIPQPPASVTTVARPPRINFAAMSVSGFPNGNTEDVCGYDWTQVGNEWAVTQTVMCDDKDLPGETVSVDPHTLSGISVTLPVIPGNVVAVIVPTPLPIPPAPTAVPTQDPTQLMLQCSQIWADWASRIALHDSREEYGTDMIPMGVVFTITGGQGFWSSGVSEDWYVSIPSFNVTNYQINGILGRSFNPVPAKGSTREYVGSGPQCSSLFAP